MDFGGVFFVAFWKVLSKAIRNLSVKGAGATGLLREAGFFGLVKTEMLGNAEVNIGNFDSC